MRRLLQIVVLSVVLILTSACDFVAYPVAGFYVSYKLDIPKTLSPDDFLEYSFCVQNPFFDVRPMFWLEEHLRGAKFSAGGNEYFVVQIVNDAGGVDWEHSFSYINWAEMKSCGIGKTTFRIKIKDDVLTERLRTGDLSIRLDLIRLQDVKLGHYFSTNIWESVLYPNS